MRMFRTIARGTASLLSGLAVLLVAAYAGLLLAGYHPVAVYSGSMVPAGGRVAARTAPRMIVCIDTNTVIQALARHNPFHPILDAWVAGG